jgi:hypothetical protein
MLHLGQSWLGDDAVENVLCLAATAFTATATHAVVIADSERLNQTGNESTNGAEALLDCKLPENVFHFLIGLYSPEFSGSGFSTFPCRMVASAS